ncbi:methylmalonyl-CoA mutase subunit beta [Luteirhabdus pelagi]|uniref:methylmalonyl-CoA mutase subunit beta n=1 Tax=Luteirhabdus pelagi TaxID=2792783 RepID=UPI00193AB88C|nr:methylmalonyl-CoA mutase subunit beta [Luteirhabdus pelagi]
MNNLFDDFPPVSAKEWKQKIQVDLKGGDYNEALLWRSLEGIDVKPFYHPDDFEQSFPPIPGQPKTWSVTQAVFIDDEKIANELAIDSINRGAEALYFSSTESFDIEKTFQNLPFEEITIYLNLEFLSEEFYKKLIDFFTQKKATVYYNIDLIGNLGRSGNWYHSLKEDHQILDTLSSQYAKHHLLSVDTETYQNAGANIVQQVAYALAHANEYLNHYSEKEWLPETKLTFKMAMGSNYFFEIAKIRALRKVYAVLAKEYGAKEECHILATPSRRNKTLYDYNVNILRTTTECMSAVLGGADAVCNQPYDTLYHKSNEFGERISRNQLLVLKEESYFDTVSNPSDGTYYIESLTSSIAEKALALFKDIEKGGGFLSQLKEGKIQQKIKESAAKEQQLFEEGTLKLLGTNYHPNKQDRMKDDLELYPFLKTDKRKTLLEPILPKRLAEKLEQERLETEEQ